MADKEELSVNELTLENGTGRAGTTPASMLIKPEVAAAHVASDSTHSVSILINGVRYYIMLTTVAP